MRGEFIVVILLKTRLSKLVCETIIPFLGERLRISGDKPTRSAAPAVVALKRLRPNAPRPLTAHIPPSSTRNNNKHPSVYTSC